MRERGGRLRVVVILAMWLMVGAGAARADFLFPRTPAPSPDGSELAFSLHGDLWTVPIEAGAAVGVPRRLTTHAGYDASPRWSPDGRRIAFSSDRYGNDDVFVLDFDANEVRQLTFQSRPDAVASWTPGGDAILFESRRDFVYHGLRTPYVVPLEGGTPREFLPIYARGGVPSPDGRYYAYSLGRYDWARKGYRGSASSDIWVYDFETGVHARLTTYDGADVSPLWAPDSAVLYFASDRTGTMNLWRMDVDGSDKQALTTFDGDGIRFPQISADGRIVAFELGFGVRFYDTATGAVRPVAVSMPADVAGNPVSFESVSGGASDLAVSPDGEQIAFVVRGEIVGMKEDGKFVRPLTETPWRERDPAWSTSSDTLVYVSDIYGQNDLFLTWSGDPAQSALSRSTDLRQARLTSTDAEESRPAFNPGGTHLTFVRGKGDLILREIRTGNERVLVSGWDPPDYAWSPDGSWLAYSKDDNDHNSDVWILNPTTGETVNVSSHPDNDTHPRWSPDGRRLGFLSQRTTRNNRDIWRVDLRRAYADVTAEEWEELYEGLKSKVDPDSVAVLIDTERLHERVHRVTSLEGDEGTFAWSPDGQTIAFSAQAEGKRDLWSIRWDGKELERLTTTNASPEEITWHPGRKLIYYIARGGKVSSIKPGGGEKKTRDFDVRLKIERRLEQRQKFQEAWRTLNVHFYDGGFHGADWDALRARYAPVAEAMQTDRDFNDVVLLMLGELNASHLGITKSGNSEDVRDGFLGLRFDPGYDGPGLRISAVTPDGPCDRPRSRASVGDILTHVDGTALSVSTNLNYLLWNRRGQDVALTLAGRGGRKEEVRVIRVKPISHGAWSGLEYKRWVDAKRDSVDAWSGGRIGYLHLRGMGAGDLQKFEAELYSAAHGRDGLVIDVRLNGGGWITDFLLAMLTAEDHAVTVHRDGSPGYPQSRRPFYAWRNPIVVLCDQYSYSNAEIFSHAIKTLGRGKVVGQKTGGLVISTGGIRLIDGSSFRVPMRGWYVKASMEPMENGGVVPDIVIENLPGDVAVGVDRQLGGAVAELLGEI